MTRGDRTKPYSNNGAVISYLQNKEARNRYTCTITCEGECFYNVDGMRLSENEFNELYPIGILNRQTKGNRIGSANQLY